MSNYEESKHRVIITDDWFPHVTGVVRTLSNMKRQWEKAGHKVSMIYPDPEKFHIGHFLLGHPEINLAYWPKAMKHSVSSQLKALDPDQIYIATPEGPLGFAGVLHCRIHNLNHSTGFHTKFAEFAAAAIAATLHIDASAILKYGYEFQRWAHRAAYRTLAPEAMVPELEERGFNNLVAWTRGVDTDLFKPGESHVYDGLPRPIFLYVGRLSYEKGLEEIPADLPGTVVFVGPGPDQIVNELKKKHPTAIFTGTKEGEALADYYRGANVFMFPSLTDTFGNVQLEALASGLALAVRPNPASERIMSVSGLGAKNHNFRMACMDALALSQYGCEETCREHIIQYYSGWAKTERILSSNIIDVKAPSRRNRRHLSITDTYAY